MMTMPETISKSWWLIPMRSKYPREKYQRDYNDTRVKRIVKAFDKRIANKPKLSYRDKKYYVFDGQHTIAVRKLMNKVMIFPFSARFTSV